MNQSVERKTFFRREEDMQRRSIFQRGNFLPVDSQAQSCAVTFSLNGSIVSDRPSAIPKGPLWLYAVWLRFRYADGDVGVFDQSCLIPIQSEGAAVAAWKG